PTSAVVPRIATGRSPTGAMEPVSRGPRLPDNNFGLAPGWWPVAFSSEISDSPRGARLGAREIAVYRERSGAVRALADRCPHRRLPLSMGRLTSHGLQCGYHGWTFDGATGQCTLIPDLRPDEKPAARFRIPTYPIVEAAGYVFLWTGSGPPDPHASPLPDPGARATLSPTWAVHGQAEVRAPHAAIADALLLNPGAALGLGWLLGGGDEILRPEVTVDRSDVVARRHRLTWNLPRISSFDPVSRRITPATVAATPATGMTVAAADPLRLGPVRIVVGLTPASPYRSTVRWRIEADGRGGGLIAERCRWVGVARRLTGRVARALEAAADSVETVTDPAVDHLRELRAAIVGETTVGEEMA
ncbi:MAG: Rieske 2Fe-2S domain-containing protein, partial [Frankia sp.]